MAMDEIVDGMSEVSCDVLVIGGGTAGPMAALKAKLRNPKANVVLLEKANVETILSELEKGTIRAAIRDDMGELLPDPRMKAAIVGFGTDGDRVLEVIEYLADHDGDDQGARSSLSDKGLSHVGLICEDLDATRARLSHRAAA